MITEGLERIVPRGDWGDANLGARVLQRVDSTRLTVFSNRGFMLVFEAECVGRQACGRAPCDPHNALGGVAQLGERNVRNVEVVGSIPITSTKFFGSHSRLILKPI